MKRQRYIYTLPSQDESPVPFDSDSASIISGNYSYPDTVWSSIISPEPDGLFPLCIYPLPYFQMPFEQCPSTSGFYNPSLTPSSLNNPDTVSHYNDEFRDVLDYTDVSTNHSTPYGDGFDPGNFPPFDETVSSENIRDEQQEPPNNFPMVTNYGAVTVLLRHLIRVDISPAKAIYVTNPPSTCVATINGVGSKSCIIHPNGRVLQDGQEIHMNILNRRAKVCRRGVIFTSTNHCLSYLVDASGTKTTAEKFRDLNNDFSLEVFYDNAMAMSNVEELYNMVDKSVYKSYWNGDEVWSIGGFRIKQDHKGDVKITRNSSRRVIRTSPTTGQMTVKTPSAEINIGRYPNNYFVLRKNDKVVTASVRGFSVQNGTQKAGFNSSGRVTLF